MTPIKQFSSPLFRDIMIVAMSVFFAVLLVKMGIIESIVTATKNSYIIGSFISGMFFTSIFTTAPATVALGEFARTGSLVATAILGGLGAVVGDLVIFKFVRDRLVNHVSLIAATPKSPRRLLFLFKHRWFRWVPFFLGGFIIASPLPDEIGVSLMGFSHSNTRTFMIFSFIFNSIGIFVVGLVARAL